MGGALVILTRRSFFKQILPAAAAIALAPTLLEELIDLDGPTFFLPPIGGWRSAGEVWQTNSLGGYLYSRELAKVLRESVQPLARFRQFADLPPRPPVTTGKFTWDVFADGT